MDKNIGIRVKMARDSLSEKIGKKVTQTELAKMCGWEDGQSRISNYEKGSRRPSSTDILKIAEVTQTDPTWLMFGHGVVNKEFANTITAAPFEFTGEEIIDLQKGVNDVVISFKLNDFLLIPKYDLNNPESEKDYLAFKKDWLKAKNLDLPTLIILDVQDDSMAPLINKNDIAMLDKSKQGVYDSKIYGLSYNSEIKIRKLNTNFDKSITISALNPSYPTEQVPSDSVDQLHIVGQVIWAGGDI